MKKGELYSINIANIYKVVPYEYVFFKLKEILRTMSMVKLSKKM